MDEPRILDPDETYLRRAQRASHMGPKNHRDLRHTRLHPRRRLGPTVHRPPTPRCHTRYRRVDLSPTELETVRAQVETDAAPLFVLAVNWIASQQLTRLGITTDSLAASIDRIRSELETGSTT